MSETDFSKATPRPWRYENDGDGYDAIVGPQGQLVVDHVGHIDGPLICASANAFDPEREKKVEAALRLLASRVGGLNELEDNDTFEVDFLMSVGELRQVHEALASLKGGDNG